MRTSHLVMILTVINPLICTTVIADDKSHDTALPPKVEIVRETQVGTGTFGAVSVLPIFASELGKSSTVSTTYNSDRITVGFAANLTTTSTSSLMMECGGTAGVFNGELIETGPGTGIFQDAKDDVAVALTPSNQTTSGTVGSQLTLKVTVPKIKWKRKTVILTKIEPLTFQAGAPLTDVILSGSLSSTTPNKIIVSFHNQRGSETLTETGPNTRVFRDAYLYTTLTVSRFSKARAAAGSQMHVIVSSSVITPSEFTTTLEETGGGTNQFSNYHLTVGPGVYDNPATDGQGVFYIQLTGTASTDVTLRSGSNQITVTATPVAGKPDLLRSGKLVLLAPNDPFRDPNITTLTVDENAKEGNVNLNVQIKTKGNTEIK